ncbi:hypothetical protein Tco_0860321 [Tanacetum coccineum]|uniref:Integrase, catalytic region, zinc finger, CCHC-type, peptidase aspartic, catalytic n=1 Tax=Tanacetum coccineum TaxID=301880 RepID=A0ABQ5BGD9_9ASTR
MYHDLYFGGNALVEKENVGFELSKPLPYFRQRPSAKGVGLRLADSHTGNHPEDDFTPLETIQRPYSVIRKRIIFELEGETFEPKRGVKNQFFHSSELGLFVDLPSELDHCTGELLESYTVSESTMSAICHSVQMANLSEDIQCAGSDTRPPMLDRTDFASWQQRIRLYCRGKENGVNILKSIDEGPFQMGTFRETLTEGTEGAPHLGPERPRVYSDLSPEDKERYNADIRATNILLQGLPKDIYSLPAS